MSSREYPKTSRRSQSPGHTRPPHSRSHHRSRSPIHNHHSSSHKRRRPNRPLPISLPQNAPSIDKHDFKTYKAIFALYLEVQKQLDMATLAEHEVKGRWKSFVGKWNRGELAEGWYGSEMFGKARAFLAESPPATRLPPPTSSAMRDRMDDRENSDDEDDLGPALPRGALVSAPSNMRSGPTIPNLQDLELQRELSQEEALDQRDQLRNHRRLDRRQQKERLDEIAPRAEAGSKDRLLEKKREKADSNRTFAAAKTEAGGVEEVPESDLLGGEDEGIAGYKRQKMEMERKKNERELKREEILRARQGEREQRIQEYKEKEARTMGGLVALAKARFG